MNTIAPTGIIKFRVEGQKAEPKWRQKILADAINGGAQMPNALRFQCRIAMDARTNLAEVKSATGDTYRLHDRSKPQFGKNIKGNAFLTATMVRDEDGKSYRFTWEGPAVPDQMVEVAVGHDLGKGVRARIINLDLAEATIVPASQVYGKNPYDELNATEKLRRGGRRNGARGAVERKPYKPRPKGSHVCARLTEADRPAAA